MKTKYRSNIKIMFDILTAIRNRTDIKISQISRDVNLDHQKVVTRLEKLVTLHLLSVEFQCEKKNNHTKNIDKIYSYHLTNQGYKALSTLEGYLTEIEKLGLDEE